MSNEFKYIFKLYPNINVTHSLIIFHFVQLFRKTENKRNTRNLLFESKVLFSLIV